MRTIEKIRVNPPEGCVFLDNTGTLRPEIPGGHLVENSTYYARRINAGEVSRVIETEIENTLTMQGNKQPTPEE